MADAAVYRAMAEGYQPTGPLGYRILIPLIARYSPFPNEIDFLCITALCTTLIIYNLIKLVEPFFTGNEWEKYLCFLWLQTGFCFSSFYDNPETDTAAFAAWFLVYRFFNKPILSACILCIATAARETTLFIIPLFAIRTKSIAKTFWISFPALVVFFSIRAFVPGTNFFEYYFLNNHLFIENFFNPHWLSQIITVFGIAPTALFMQRPKTRCFKNYKTEFFILLFFAVLSCCIAAALDRFIFILFPFILVPACSSLLQMSALLKSLLLIDYLLLLIAKFYFIKYWMINEWYEVLVYFSILSIPVIISRIYFKNFSSQHSRLENPSLKR
mgnify:CR=1 FL=1